MRQSQNRWDRVCVLNFVCSFQRGTFLGHLSCFMYPCDESDYLLPQPETINLKQEVSLLQAGILMVAIYENWKNRKTQRFSSVPLDGLVLKTGWSDFLSYVLRAVCLELKLNFSWNYWTPGYKMSPGTQTARYSGNTWPVLDFNKKKTVAHLADTHEPSRF